MSKTKVDITKEVLAKIEKGQVKMKPKWFFVVGSVAMIIGITGAYVLSVFLISLISFSIRTHGMMAAVRYEQMINNFPWWAVGVAILGITLGVLLLRKYDFSYKKNFLGIIIIFVMAVILSGWLVDFLGLDSYWSKRGPMQKIYQQYDGKRGRVLPARSDENVLPGYQTGQGGRFRYTVN